MITALSSVHDITHQIARQEDNIQQLLAQYDPLTATHAWLNTIRAIEEWINLPFVDWDDDQFEKSLMALPVIGIVNEMERLVPITQRMEVQLSRNFSSRFITLLTQCVSIAQSFSLHGYLDAAPGFKTVGTMVGFWQSRRRHCIGLLHLLPTACRGTNKVEQIDTLNIFLPVIELQGIPMVSAERALLYKRSRECLGLPQSVYTNIAMLDAWFLEPERAPITSMIQAGAANTKMLESREETCSDQLFSAAELRNDILFSQAAYAEFDIMDTSFGPLAELIRHLSRHYVVSDYWLRIRPDELTQLYEQFNVPKSVRQAIINTSETYAGCLQSYAPFILIDGFYLSNVSLLSRFIYYWRAESLEKNRRFKIRAGFIFEKEISEALQQQGFRITMIKRINNHEFDVVTLRDNMIWNFQCKNNFTSLSNVESDAERFARFNRRLVRMYEAALRKEYARENLLKEKLGLEQVQHLVVSRFPIVSDNARIIPFSQIRHLSNSLSSIVQVQTQSKGV